MTAFATHPLTTDSVAAAARHGIDTVEGDIVPGSPPGAGKPSRSVNALHRRFRGSPARRRLSAGRL